MSERLTPAQMREINETIRYSMWSVFASASPLGDDRDKALAELEAFLAETAEQGVVVRGLYDVAGLRGDADVMVWWHAATIEQLQAAYHGFLRTEVGQHLEPVWSNAALHRPAEFNKSHIPAFMADEQARRYVCVYPFVRSYEWYLLDEKERRDLLREHGQMARDYPDVRANTIASFALGDYEWLLAFEADELHRIVDLMRELRASGARRHVREEIPFFTGPARRARAARRQPALTARLVLEVLREDGDGRDEQQGQPRPRQGEGRETDERREGAQGRAQPAAWGRRPDAGRLRRAGSASKRGLGSGRSAKSAVTSERVTASRARPRRSS